MPNIFFKSPACKAGLLHVGYLYMKHPPKRLLRCILLPITFMWACKQQPTPAGEKPADSRPITAVYILPLNEADNSALKVLQKGIADSFRVNVTILPAATIPANAWYAARKRYWADSILHWMKKKPRVPGEKWLAVTGKDIAASTIKQHNWGVMGLAHQPGSVCVVSDYRLNSARVTPAQRHHKLLKIALHELAHTTGLPHCSVSFCLLADAEGKDKTDQLTSFCSSCRKRLLGR